MTKYFVMIAGILILAGIPEDAGILHSIIQALVGLGLMVYGIVEA